MLNDKELENAINASPAPRVTLDYMMSRVSKTEFIRVGETVTICNITLDNGYSVRGESACVNPENFNQEIGEKIAHNNAVNSLWPLFGFLLAENNFQGRALDV